MSLQGQQPILCGPRFGQEDLVYCVLGCKQSLRVGDVSAAPCRKVRLGQGDDADGRGHHVMEVQSQARLYPRGGPGIPRGAARCAQCRLAGT